MESAYDFSAVTQRLKQGLSYMNHRMSFLVMKKDGTILTKQHLASKGHEPYDDNTTLHVASGVKWVAMATIMSLVEDGIMNINETVGEAYPTDAPAEVKNLTLLQMMTHTSGYELADDWIFDTELTLAQSVHGIFKGGTVYEDTKDESHAKKSKTHFKPGKCVGYSDIGMQIAGGMAELRSGQDFNTLFQQRIASKLGMVNAKFTAFDGEKGPNTAIADGLVIRMIDYANFMKMLLNKGTHNGVQVLKQQTVAAMLKDYTGHLPVHDVMKDLIPEDMTEVSYGIGSWIYESDKHGNGIIFTSPGIHGFENYIDVKNEYLMVMFLRTSTQNEPKVTDLSESLRPIIQRIVLSGGRRHKQQDDDDDDDDDDDEE